LLTCVHDGCTVTAERKKGKYVYYRCSHGRGKCPLPYTREEALSDRMAELLKGIYVPETVARTIVDSLRADSARAEAERQQRIAGVQQRLATLRARMDQAYEDRLDGRIDYEFWTRKMNASREQQRILESELAGLRTPVTESVLSVKRIFELSNQAYFLYLTKNAAERGQLLKSVLSNCETDGVTFAPTYRKPFDLIFERAKTEEWWAL
jgi:site-specific DNA recombinase